MKFNYLTASVLCALSFSATAENTEQSIPAQTTETSGFYFSIGSVSFDSKVSGNEGVEDSALHWRLGYEQNINNFVWALGFSSYSYDDLQGGTVDVINQNTGSTSESDSSAVAINLYGEAGYNYTLNEQVDLSLMAGYEMVTSSERSHAQCTNCPTSEIEIEGGLYLQPRIRFSFDGDWYVSGAFNTYLTGDATSGLLFTIGAEF